MKNHLLGYVCLPLGLVAFLGGIHYAHDTAAGYAGIVLGIVLVLVAFKTLRAPTSSSASTEVE